MLSDAHCHPFDLREQQPQYSQKECAGIVMAASSWNREQFEYNKSNAAVQTFAVHPQLPLINASEVKTSLELLYTLSSEDKIDAIGETGFDLFDDFRSTEAVQDDLFASHMEVSIAKELPMVLHVRRAVHKVFSYSKMLKKVPAVIFHSCSLTVEEGATFLKRGINTYFSFGTPILLNHKTAQRACALLPLERLLIETDTPYQPLRGKAFSCWGDLRTILSGMQQLRGENSEGLEDIIYSNFCKAYQV
jgi:TatD DNase family protein